ncbi:hypothetical protein [Mesorhizobium sp. WSM3866]|uniref:hypothetical protein n=1 Tax=Mesorhizobium sp. WSM3866 TaxID=422271 RepID=UPI001140BD81|nr:hypothetical protein [Mesorhizobium sp. WSM3866]
MNEKVKGEARRKIILDGYVNNEPLKDIAAKLGCSLASLKASASKLGCTRARKRRLTFDAASVYPTTNGKTITSSCGSANIDLGTAHRFWDY